jgi:hypothetical protein
VEHYYPDVKGLGNVAVSRHAQDRIADLGISEGAFRRTLLEPVKPDMYEGPDIIWRERDSVRIVILTNPVPFRGAKLVKTVYRVERPAPVRRWGR